MSAIEQPYWAPYLRPSFRGRPTTGTSPAATIPYERLSTAAREPRLLPSHLQIDSLSSLPHNWDGHGSVKPDAHSVERARQLLEEAFRNSQAVGWQSPYISASENGEIVLEWWNGVRKLTIYVGPERSTYLKSWGPHVVDEMVDGVLEENWDPLLWSWLFE